MKFSLDGDNAAAKVHTRGEVIAEIAPRKCDRGNLTREGCLVEPLGRGWYKFTACGDGVLEKALLAVETAEFNPKPKG
jgi:hypothetical protein